MKKLLLTLTLSLSLLISSTTIAAPTQTNQIILHVQSSIPDPYSNLYIAEVLDENGDLYVIQSYDDISNHWLDATINQDYEILNYTIMD